MAGRGACCWGRGGGALAVGGSGGSALGRGFSRRGRAGLQVQGGHVRGDIPLSAHPGRAVGVGPSRPGGGDVPRRGGGCARRWPLRGVCGDDGGAQGGGLRCGARLQLVGAAAFWEM